MLGTLRCCTWVVKRLAAAVDAWQRWLDYRLIARGYVSAEQSRLWGADAMAGRACAVLAPAGDADVCVRFIESGEADRPLLAWGWNALEILVADVYTLAHELRASPFEILIEPRPLPYDPRIHAMQVLGVAGELLYLTQLPTADAPLGLAPARRRVDRPFIAIAGGPSLTALIEYYATTFGNESFAGSPTLIQIVNDRFALPSDHRTALGVVRLAPGYLIELDELPPAAARGAPRRPGELPFGLAMVSFEVDPIRGPPPNFRAPPATLFEVPYDGARVAVTEGAAGEWLELIER